MIDAVRNGDVRAVQTLLGREPALASRRDPDGTSMVLLACERGHRRVVEALLAAGPDLDVFDAAALGHVNQLEIALGLDPTLATMTTGGGATALHLAARYGHADAARRLLDAGADPDAADDAGDTALDVAVRHEHSDLVALLRPS